MRGQFLLSQLFNQPHMVLPDVLHEAVAWAGERAGIELRQLGVHVAAALQPAAWRDDGDRAAMASQSEQRMQSAQQTGLLVIPVQGLLVAREANVNLCATQTSYEGIRTQIQAGLNDPRISAMVLELDSPGGAVVGCFELVADIEAAKAVKPIHALVHFNAFSAAYAIACACSDITLSESSGVGSIGVIMKHADFSQQLASAGVAVTTFYRGARKNDMASDAPLSDDARAAVEKRMDAYYDKFAGVVASNRGLSVAAVKATDAGLFFGTEAVLAGLADRVESQQLAINRMAAEVAASRTPPLAPSRRATAAAMAMATQL